MTFCCIKNTASCKNRPLQAQSAHNSVTRQQITKTQNSNEPEGPLNSATYPPPIFYGVYWPKQWRNSQFSVSFGQKMQLKRINLENVYCTIAIICKQLAIEITRTHEKMGVPSWRSCQCFCNY